VHTQNGTGVGERFWRERAEQLQHALDSRIVIEQAKGILSERFGLGLDGAFGLLRYAARSERMKLHVLADAVVNVRETPEPVVRALARQAETFVAVPRRRRIAETEELYRRLNVAIASLLDGGSGSFLCECGNPLCNELIELGKADLEKLHATAGHYAVVPGHELPELESVVASGSGYAVVSKNGG
jgi:hypothetical protein